MDTFVGMPNGKGEARKRNYAGAESNRQPRARSLASVFHGWVRQGIGEREWPIASPAPFLDVILLHTSGLKFEAAVEHHRGPVVIAAIMLLGGIIGFGIGADQGQGKMVGGGPIEDQVPFVGIVVTGHALGC